MMATLQETSLQDKIKALQDELQFMGCNVEIRYNFGQYQVFINGHERYTASKLSSILSFLKYKRLRVQCELFGLPER